MENKKEPKKSASRGYFRLFLGLILAIQILYKLKSSHFKFRDFKGLKVGEEILRNCVRDSEGNDMIIPTSYLLWLALIKQKKRRKQHAIYGDFSSHNILVLLIK
uniref:Uncharacterized protein n=1 Tax=Glossina pallidipes TaxID=7398 RepID=A0A1B0AC52_GLOPL